MTETDIRKYAELMQELNLTGLEITADDGKVRLERTAPGTATATIPVPVAAAAAPGAVLQDGTPAAAYVQSANGTPADYTSVTSPIVGVFYAAPAENADPYVKVGDQVHKGQVLCIVEAMKLMNEITADADGTIEEICVTDGQVVEYGTELFHIR